MRVGRTCHLRTLRTQRLVYRDAEFAHADSDSHHAESGEYPGFPLFCVRIGDEGRGCSHGNAHRPMVWIFNGLPALHEVLWHTGQQSHGLFQRNIRTRVDAAFLRSEPRYLLSHGLYGLRDDVFHVGRFLARRGYSGR